MPPKSIWEHAIILELDFGWACNWDCIWPLQYKTSSYAYVLTIWAEKWQMQFNTNKCSILQLSKHHHKSFMSGKFLKNVEQYPYLGIQIDHHLSWNSQVDNVCSKAARLLGFLQHNLCNCLRNSAINNLSYQS